MTSGDGRSDRRWLALSVVLLATFMDFVDVTIVNVALPTIQRDLGASYAAGQWIVAGYSLAYALLLVTGGRLGDIAGRRRVFMIGVVGFTVVSVVAGFADTAGVLIAARVAQGAFAGVMVPQAMSVIMVQFPPGRERTLALSLYGLILGAAQGAGPLLGGLLTGTGEGLFGLGWRPIFLINVPVGIFALYGALRWMKESRSSRPPRLDLVGVALISAASLLLGFPLMQGRELGWPVWSLGCLAAGVPMLVLFAWYERRRERRGAGPLVPMTLFRHRSFSAGLIVMLVLFSGISAYFITLTWALQFGLGWTPIHVALIALAWPAGIACTAQLTHRFGHPYARRLVGCGMALSATATAVLGYSAARYGTELTDVRIGVLMFIAGVGMGMTVPILAHLILSQVPSDDAGAASGVLNSAGQLGTAFGVAFAGLVFFGGSHRLPGFEIGAPRAFWYVAGVFALVSVLSSLLPRRITHAQAPQTKDERDESTIVSR